MYQMDLALLFCIAPFYIVLAAPGVSRSWKSDRYRYFFEIKNILFLFLAFYHTYVKMTPVRSLIALKDNQHKHSFAFMICDGELAAIHIKYS